MGSVPWWTPRKRHDEEPVVRAARPRLDALGAGTGRERPRLGVEATLARATAAEGVEVEPLASPCRDRATVRAREAVVLLGVERYGLRCRNLAAALGRSADQGHAPVCCASPSCRC